MELKKSISVDLELRKPLFLQIGLAASLLIVFLAFEFVGSKEKKDDMLFTSASKMTWGEEQMMLSEQMIFFSTPSPQSISQTAIEILPDNQAVEDVTLTTEINESSQTEESDNSGSVHGEASGGTGSSVGGIYGLGTVEIMPEFPGGEVARERFIIENTQYSTIARASNIEGIVTVCFTVEADGRITDVELMRGKHPELDAEALRVTRSMPKWRPARQHGRAVAVRLTMPIKFALN